MGARGAPSGFVTALQQPHVVQFELIDLMFDGAPQYLCALDFAVAYGGNTYSNALGVATIADVSETADSFEGLKITISGVQTANLSLFLTNKIRGRVATLRSAAISGGTLTVDDGAWAGYMDTPLVTHGGDGQATIEIACENRFASWSRHKPVFFTNGWQQARFPGDLGLEFVESTANKRITFPSAEWWRQS